MATLWNEPTGLAEKPPQHVIAPEDSTPHATLEPQPTSINPLCVGVDDMLPQHVISPPLEIPQPKSYPVQTSSKDTCGGVSVPELWYEL